MMDGMCGRYVSPMKRPSSVNSISCALNGGFRPTSISLLVGRARHSCPRRDREGVLLRWGLMTLFGGGKPGKYNTFNARSETLASSAMFGGPWKHGQRCIIPALGFYEWHVNADGTKQPFYIHLRIKRSSDSPGCGRAGRAPSLPCRRTA